MVGGLTAMVEGQRVPPWQAWGLSVLLATMHAKSPSCFSLPALLQNQTLAVVLGFLGLLGLCPSGLSGLRVFRVYWAKTLPHPETPLTTFTLSHWLMPLQYLLRRDVSGLVLGTHEVDLVHPTHQR